MREVLGTLVGADSLEQALAEGRGLTEDEAVMTAFELAARLGSEMRQTP